MRKRREREKSCWSEKNIANLAAHYSEDVWTLEREKGHLIKSKSPPRHRQFVHPLLGIFHGGVAKTPAVRTPFNAAGVDDCTLRTIIIEVGQRAAQG